MKAIDNLKKIHDLKTWKKYFEDVYNGDKGFEVRKNDRDFKVGETLFLREWDNFRNTYTGRGVFVVITYILHGGQFGIEEGFCVMGISRNINQ